MPCMEGKKYIFVSYIRGKNKYPSIYFRFMLKYMYTWHINILIWQKSFSNVTITFIINNILYGKQFNFLIKLSISITVFFSPSFFFWGKISCKNFNSKNKWIPSRSEKFWCCKTPKRLRKLFFFFPNYHDVLNLTS